MRHYVQFLSILSTGTLLGCSQLSLAPTQPQSAATAVEPGSVLSRIQPVTRINSPVSELENLWIQGRQAQGQGQLALAEDHYVKVLKERPTHPGAMNALAVIYAQTDRLPQAISLLEQALALQPQASHVFNNLGYALLLAGRLNESEAALKRAHELNPSSALTRKNKELLAQAQARSATEVAVVAEIAPLNAPVAPTLVSIAPNVYELREPVSLPRGETTPAPAPSEAVTGGGATAPVAPRDATARLSGLRIEVSNGMGVRHMARRTAERLVPLGLVTARLTNQPGYRQVKTELQYGTGQEAAAEVLARRLPQAPELVAAKQLGSHIQLRLVLGHDLRGRAMTAWLDAPDGAEMPVPLVQQPSQTPPPPLALNPQQGWRWS